DPDNLAAPFNAGLTVVAVGAAGHGTVGFTTSGVTYTPALNCNADDSTTDTVSDNVTTASGQTSQATVNVTVTNVNDAPVASIDTATLTADSSAISLHDALPISDPDNLAAPFNAGLTVVAVGAAGHGTVGFTTSGVTYTPA